MADFFTNAQRSAIMASVRSCGNKATELRLVAIFRENKITGWRRNVRVVGQPDFVFQKKRVAVFVDGCFWHGCPRHLRMPNTNRPYWQSKTARTRARDLLVNQKLKRFGWRVVRVWEHSLRTPDLVAEKLRAILSCRQLLQSSARSAMNSKQHA